MVSQRRGFELFFFLLYGSFSGYVMFRNVYLEELGMSGTRMGLVGLLFTACTMLAQPLWGLVADWTRASKRILYASAVCSGLSVLAYPLAPLATNAFLVVAVGTIVFAAFRAPARPLSNALVLSTGLPFERVRAFGSVAFGVTGLGIGVLADAVATEVAFYVYAVGMALVVALLAALPVGESDDALETELTAAAIRRLLDRRFGLLLLSAFGIGVMTPAGSAFLSVYVRSIGQADSITGAAWFVKTVGEAVTFLYVARRGGSYRRLLALAGVLYGGTYVVLLLTADVRLVLAAQLLLGVGYALFTLASVNLAYVLSEEALNSTAQSLLLVGGASAGTGIGELLTGVLVDAVGVRPMYGYVAGIGVLVALVSLRIPARPADPLEATGGDGA